MTSFNPPKTRANIEADLTLARQNSDFATEAACLIALGDMAKENEEYNLAQGLYGQAWAVYEKLHDQRQTVQAILALVNVFSELRWKNEDFETLFIARSLCDEALKTAEQTHDYASQGRVWKVKADLMSDEFWSQKLKRPIYTKAIQLCEQGHDPVGQADAIMRLGSIEMESHTYEQARTLFGRALHLYRQNNHYEGQANALSYLAAVADRQCDINAKKSYYAHTVSVYNQLNQPFKAAEVLQKLGKLALEEKDYDRALKCHKEELALYEHKYGYHYENALYCLGLVTEAAKDYEEALSYYTKALALSNKDDAITLASRLFALARIYAAMGDINTGRHYAQEAMTTNDSDPRVDRFYHSVFMHWQWGEIEYKAEFYETGCSLCREALVLAQGVPIGRHILDVWEQDLAAMNCPTRLGESTL